MQTVGNIFLDDSKAFVCVSFVLSFVSIIKGHISFVDARKKGHLPLVGTVILLAYFGLGTIARLFATIRFFTPLLGLFNVLKLAETGMMPASAHTVYDVNATTNEVTSLAEAWGEIRASSLSDLFSGSAVNYLYLSIPPILILFHLLAMLTIWKCFTIKSGYWEVLYTFVCPPLFVDWEQFHNHNGLSVKGAWIKSKFMLASGIAVSALENLALCTPLAMLRYNMSLRVAALEDMLFVLLPQERYSVQFVNALLAGAGATFLLALPAAQLLLSLLYFKHGHAWSKLLKIE